MEHSELVCVKNVKGKGRGVFARCAIAKGAVVERVPVVLIPINQMVDGKKNPVLKKYFYEWSATTIAVSLGYGSLYNHSYTPNADYEHGAKVLVYRALRDIQPGEEITVNYNGKPTDRRPVGFEVVVICFRLSRKRKRRTVPSLTLPAPPPPSAQWTHTTRAAPAPGGPAPDRSPATSPAPCPHWRRSCAATLCLSDRS